jgi:CubicO group peptidase (beta-lactamase class C family)
MLRVLLLVFALSACAAEIPALDQLGEAERQRAKIPGLVLVAVKGDQVIYAKGFGVAGIETNEPVTPDHLFRVGSTTKMFVGAAVVKLAEQGKLKMDEPIGNHIRNIDPSLAKLTAHQLLSHTAGLWDRTLMFGPHDDSALEANVASWKSEIFFTEPDQVVSYSNMGYVLAGRLIEAVTGKPFGDAMPELLFGPLGMKRTTFRPTMAMTWPLAQGHVETDGKLAIARPAADHAGYWPAGSMFTSGNDFSRWAIAFLNEGKLNAAPVLSTSLIRAMSTPRVSIPGTVSGRSYAYGLTIDDSAGSRVIEHGGSRHGYTSALRMSPEFRIAVITIGNKSGGDVSTLAEKAFGHLMPVRSPAVKTGMVSSLPLDSYRGDYFNGPNKIAVGAADGKLSVEAQGRMRVLQPAPGGCFESEKGGGPVCFVSKNGATYLMQGLRSYKRK